MKVELFASREKNETVRRTVNFEKIYW